MGSLAVGHTTLESSRLLGRSGGTVSRELRRNCGGGLAYHGGVAEVVAAARLRRSLAARRPKLSGRLLRYVQRGLRRGRSPEQIQGRLRHDFPDEAGMRISHETIYAYVSPDKRAGGDWWRHLRHGRRRKRKIGRRSGGVTRGRVPLSERPAVANRRARVGDFEGDTIVRQGARSCLVTMVDRKSRFLMTSLAQSKEARLVGAVQRRQIARIPRGSVKTLTLDNGTEFAEHALLSSATGVSVYFASPYCSWERGACENANGLHRGYFPKGTDFRKISAARLAAVTAAINNRLWKFWTTEPHARSSKPH